MIQFNTVYDIEMDKQVVTCSHRHINIGLFVYGTNLNTFVVYGCSTRFCQLPQLYKNYKSVSDNQIFQVASSFTNHDSIFIIKCISQKRIKMYIRNRDHF